MKLPGKGTLIANAALFGLVLVLYVADVFDYVRARTADVSALTELPRVGYAAAVLFASLVAAALFVFGVFTDKPPSFRGYRLLPIVAIVAIFVDIFILSADSLPVPPSDQLLIVLNGFAHEASQRSTPERVLTSDHELLDLVKDLGQPPYLVKGQRAQGYTVQRRMDCDGPVREAPGAQVGTILYCVARDQKRAWVTVVALPIEERFGVPRVLSRKGEPLGVMVEPPAPEEPAEELTGDDGAQEGDVADAGL